MINSATVFTKGGAILWTKNVTSFNPLPINKLIQNAILEEQNDKYVYKHSLYNIKWTPEKNLNIIFVVVYLNISHLMHIDQLLQNFKERFCEMYRKELPGTTLVEKPNFNFTKEFERMEMSFKPVMANKPKTLQLNNKVQSSTKQLEDTQPISNLKNQKCIKTPSSLTKNESKKQKDKGEFEKSNNEKKLNEKDSKEGKNKTKNRRVWSDKKLSKSEKMALDFSKSKENNPLLDENYYSVDKVGREDKGEVNLASSDDNCDDFDESNEKTKSPFYKKLTNIFTQLASKQLTSADLKPAMAEMERLLIDKNVAVEVARRICESVQTEIEGKSVSKLSLTRQHVRKAFYDSLVGIITPRKNINLLRDIAKAREENRPYSVVFVGVNGVGKSTSLAKLAFYLQSRNLRVSIAACDTFRSGAVEQLMTHAKALNIRIFHKGYAKDATQVCSEAICEAKKASDDVILIDTAGRMQNNEPLMNSLKKLVEENLPDLVLFVGEALVGNEALDQLDKFIKHVSIDGIILTKFDAVDDKVGAAISMTYKKKLPILFLGTGQTYGELKKMNPEIMARQLLK